MPISFSCSNCQSTIRVPDGSEGKKTRCPKCEEIQQIPDQSESPPSPSNFGGSSSGSESDALWASLDSGTTSNEPSSRSNPFGDGPDPYGAPAHNPYASPAIYANHVSRKSARIKLLGPVTGVLIITFLGLGYLAFSYVIQINQIDILMAQNGIKTPPQRNAFLAGFYGFYLVIFFFGFITIASMIRAFWVRNYGLVMTGFVLAMMPCSSFCFCVGGIPFAIWGIVILLDETVKSAFRLP